MSAVHPRNSRADDDILLTEIRKILSTKVKVNAFEPLGNLQIEKRIGLRISVSVQEIAVAVLDGFMKS